MGGNYTKEQQALWSNFNPKLRDACTNPSNFMTLLNQLRSEILVKKDLHIIVVDSIKVAIKSPDVTDKSKFHYLLVEDCNI